MSVMSARHWVCAAALAAAAGAANAQGAPAAVAAPDWGLLPTLHDLELVTPGKAWSRHEEGRVELRCEADSAGWLRHCAVTRQTPADLDFGKAALSVTRLFRVVPGPGQAGAVDVWVRFPTPDWAQLEPPTPAPLTPVAPQLAHWSRTPNDAERRYAMPQRAYVAGRPGRTLVRCTVQADGGLSGCTTDSEEPAGWGFGAAGRSLAAKYRMDRKTKDGASTEGSVVVIPMSFP
jgi:hypothetical protein